METIKLKALHHRDMECIGIYSMQNGTLNYYFQKKAGAKWSRTNRCWYVPHTEKNYELLAKVLKGKVILEVEELKKYLLEKKKNELAPAIHNPKSTDVTVIKSVNPPPAKPVQKFNPVIKLNKENYGELQKFQQQLVLKN